jgi:iron complex transport system permease protein
MFMVSLAIGSVSIPLDQVGIILSGGVPERSSWAQIIWQFRLPRALTASVAGAALSVSGLEMQTLFANPLAGPFILGINAGASLGVAAVILGAQIVGVSVLGGNLSILGNIGIATAACGGSLLTLVVVLVVAQQVQNRLTILLLGLMLGYITNSLVTILLQFSLTEQIQAYLNWTFGSFSSVTKEQLWILIPTVIIGLLIAYGTGKAMNLLLLGETQAKSLGLSIETARFCLIGSAALLAGIVTAFCGPIAFIGVAVPHLARGLLKSLDHLVLLPAVTLLGSIVALFADLLAQLPGRQSVLPLNAVTALIGGPIIIFVILQRQEKAGQ